MKDMEIKIKRIENGKLPTYETEGSAGADCYARLEEPVIIEAGKRGTIPLGFAVEIPEGYEMQIRPRSGLAKKNGIKANLGTIDSDYRGEVCAIIFNEDAKEDCEIKNGDRIAQAVICPVIRAEWHLTDKLSETERGEKGFGSTGINNEVEKFYEPFTYQDYEKLNEYTGLNIKIGKDDFKIISVNKKIDEAIHYLELSILNILTKTVAYVSASYLFQVATIDNHRFGKVIEG